LKSCDDSFQPRVINGNPGNGIRAMRFVRRAGIEYNQLLHTERKGEKIIFARI